MAILIQGGVLYPTYDFNLVLSKSAEHKDGNPDYSVFFAVDGNEVPEVNADDTLIHV